MTATDVTEGRRPWAVEEACALGGLARLPGGCAHLCCTSPPFYALRDYKVAPTAWPAVHYAPMPGLPPLAAPAMECCLGAEPTPEAYVGHLVLILREVRRVLREDGTCWLNLGDGFASSGVAPPQRDHNNGRYLGTRGRHGSSAASEVKRPRTVPAGLKAKDLIGIPWRVAFAAQADGWYLRQAISWQKTCPMPSSARDRPTTATEEIFLLAKSATYYYDLDACREPISPATIGRDRYTRIYDSPGEQYGVQHDHETKSDPAGRNLWSWWDIPIDEDEEAAPRLPWRLGPEPQGGGHVAVFPSEIPRRAVLLGTSEQGCCSACGAPRRRVVERTTMKIARSGWAEVTGNRTMPSGTMLGPPASKTLGWRPSCACDSESRPCLVLDPFSGSGTTGLVATALGRRFVGFEVSPGWAARSRERIAGGPSARTRRGPAAPGLFDGKP